MMLHLTFSAKIYCQDPDLDQGRNIMYHSFKDARPLYFRSSLVRLKRIWAAKAKDPQERLRLAKIRVLTPEWYREIRLRYGIFKPHYKNGAMPLGITAVKARAKQQKLFFPGAISPVRGAGGEAAININCQLCHSRSVPTKNGLQVAEGIGNSHIDFQGFHEDMAATFGSPVGVMLKRNPRGNSYVSAGDALGVISRHVRADDDKFNQIELGRTMASKSILPRLQELADFIKTVPLTKTPAWTAIGSKVKNGVSGFYADGAWGGGFSHVLAGTMISLKASGSDFKKYRKKFDAYAWPYLQTLKTPKFDWRDELDPKKVVNGHDVYESNCSYCHGSYSQDGKNNFVRDDYPAALVELSDVETDPRRALYTDEYIKRNKKNGRVIYNLSEEERGGTGYVAPPLDGVWARSPYLHNGSVPNLAQLLNSPTRIKVYASDLAKNDPATIDSFDRINGGWKIEDYSHKSVAQIDRELDNNPYLRVFDPRRPEVVKTGLGNMGHQYGDHLEDTERKDLIQFLLTL